MVNHDEIAIAAHKALNPHTRHLCADIYEVCPLEATGNRYVNILWGSPDCRDHSVAKGGAPRSPRVRSMPWQMCRWVGVLKKRGKGVGTIFLENVREIRGWGPLIAKRDKVTGRVLKLDGSVAAPGERVPVQQQQLVRDPKKVGRIYRAWVKHMRGLGVTYEDRDLLCANYGVPTIRKRLFGVGHTNMALPQWPIQTHAHRHSAEVKSGKYLRHVPASSFIDFSLPMTSIFDRPKDLARATQKRVAVGMGRYVIDAAEPFLVHLTHQGGDRARSGEEPISTLTTAKRGEMAVVAPQVANIRAANHQADKCQLAAGHLIGVAHGDDSRSGSRAYDIQESLRTNTASNDQALIAVHLEKFNENSRGQSVNEPLDTLMAGAPRFGVIGSYLVPTGYGERQGQVPRCQDIQDSIGTQVAGAAKHVVVAAHMTEFRSRSVGQDLTDGGPTLTVHDHHGVVGAYMVEQRGESIGQDIQESLGAQTQVPHHTVAGAYLVHQRGTSTATSLEDASRALTTGGNHGGDHVGVAAAKFHLHVADQQPARFGLAPHEVYGLTESQYRRARRVAEFLRNFGVWDGGDVVIVGQYVIVDIVMRMLTHWEAAAAHELKLPDLIRVRKRDRKGNFVFDEKGEHVWIERPLTKTEATRLIGNSVPKRMAKLLALANCRAPLAMAAAE
ncbi:MAG: DNA cytosine methyltransferase [Desulfovibrio sp.]|uniref:hypothetical protein n=1 Tax=Desulfovibrio sp. TaxID=885 RepID=UPI00135E9A79|nr:hypothetical protein [Desulfovibrio sp.]MTJ93594.1 DNA cytosine methyltransferase [Desulfovibrio sp.]